MSVMTEIRVDVPKALWLSANDRLHWRPRHARTQALKAKGKVAAIQAGRPRHHRTEVVVYVAYPKGTGRADPGNAYPTVKALIDGMTLAGIWEDDDSRHVIGPGFDRDPNTSAGGLHTLRFVLTEVHP